MKIRSLSSGSFMLIIIMLLISGTSSCYVNKAIPYDDLSTLQKKKNSIRIHYDDSIVLLKSYRISENVLTGEPAGSAEIIKPGEIADIYIAPSEALIIDGNKVSVPVINIARIDYRGHDALSITVGSVLAFLFLVFPGLFAM